MLRRKRATRDRDSEETKSLAALVKQTLDTLPPCCLVEKQYVVYVLRHRGQRNLSYVGSTNNFSRRLRQHNGLLSGGAKYTASAPGPWLPAAIVWGLPDKSSALKVEWWCKAKHYVGTALGRQCPSSDMARRRVWLILQACSKLGVDSSSNVAWLDSDFKERYEELTSPLLPAPNQ